jgi:precorrin-4 methylase
MHQTTNCFARERSAKRGNVSQAVVLTRVHMLMNMRTQPSRRKRVRHSGKHVTCTWHVSKAKREVHEQIQNKLKTKCPAHNFNESRAVKG